MLPNVEDVIKDESSSRDAQDSKDFKDSRESNTDSLESVKSRKYTEDEWLAYYNRTRRMQEHARNWAEMLLTVGSIILCILFFFTCKPCLFAIIIFSAILCPCFHSMNAPLWIAIAILVLTGWSFTTGRFSINWSGQTF